MCIEDVIILFIVELDEETVRELAGLLPEIKVVNGCVFGCIGLCVDIERIHEAPARFHVIKRRLGYKSGPEQFAS